MVTGGGSKGIAVVNKAVCKSLDLESKLLEEVSVCLGELVAGGLDYDIVYRERLLGDVVQPCAESTDVVFESREVLCNLPLTVSVHFCKYLGNVEKRCGV